MSADWRAIVSDLGHLIADGVIVLKLEGDRQQRLFADETHAGVLRFWSVILGPAATSELGDGHPLEYAWERNRLSDLVGYSVDGRGRLIGETWLPVSAINRELVEVYISELARVCDWHELRLTGSDAY